MSTLGDITMTLEVDSKVWSFRVGDFSAVDARDFRNATGLRILDVFNTPDLDGIAGLLWISRRRLGEDIAYEDIAGELSYDSINFRPDKPAVAAAAAEAIALEDVDPEE